jgi:hypothetical protein
MTPFLPRTKSTFFLRLLPMIKIASAAICVSVLASCVAGSTIANHSYPKFGAEYVTEGAGIKLTIARIQNAEEWLAPLRAQYEAGESNSPVQYFLFPCRGRGCERGSAAEIVVAIRRETTTDADVDLQIETLLRARVSRRMAEIEKRLQSVKGSPGGFVVNETRFIGDKLTILNLGGFLWAKTPFVGSRENERGATYWRVISPDLTLTIRYWMNGSLLPGEVNSDFMDDFVRDFVSRVRVAAVPRPK